MKIPERSNDTYGWILYLQDGDEIEFVGNCPFNWDHRHLHIYSETSKQYVFRLVDVARLDQVVFRFPREGGVGAMSVIETFCFE